MSKEIGEIDGIKIFIPDDVNFEPIDLGFRCTVFVNKEQLEWIKNNLVPKASEVKE